MILQTDMTDNRSVGHTGELAFSLFIQAVIYDFHAIKGNLEVMPPAFNYHPIPFSWFFGHILTRAYSADNATVVMMTHLIIGFSCGIKNLAFDTRFHWVFRVPDSKKYSAISFG